MTSARWAERVPAEDAVVLRPEGHATILRGLATDVSLTGVGVRVHEEDELPTGLRVGVTLAGDGRGAIAFRARVVRRATEGTVTRLGLEILAVSAEDHARLARLVRRLAPAS